MCYPLRPRRLLAVLAVASLVTRVSGAQTAESTAVAVGAIAADDIARHVGVLAHDSMRGRDTPSPSLERTAQYVAEQFRALGLQPPTGDTSMIQRYPLPGRSPVDNGRSKLWLFSQPQAAGRPVVDEGGDSFRHAAELDFATAAIFATDTLLERRAPGARGGGQGALTTEGPIGPAPIVVAGPHTLASVRQARLHDKVVVYVPGAGLDSATQRQVVGLLAASNHVIIVADEDSAAFARRRTARMHPPVVLDWYLPEAEEFRRWVVYVWASAIRSCLATAGFDLAEARNAPTPIVREVSAVAVLGVTAGAPNRAQTAPNTVGVLQGTDDPREAVVLTAHMDGAGRRHEADSLVPDIDDNASGVTGLIALAKAFAQAARASAGPRRSVVFAAISGGMEGFGGSSALLDTWHGVGRPVLNINLDRIGRTAGDSVYVNGLREVELAVRPEWLAAQHPEVGLTVVDGGSVVTPESDHFAFVRRRVPSLYVHGRARGAAATEASDRVDAEQEARLLRFVFYLARDVGDAPRVPRWTPEGRRRRSLAFGE